MKPLVEFCASNVASYTQAVVDALENDPELDVDVLEYGCLGYCGECYMEPFALVNGKLVQAPSAEALLDKIKKELQDEEDIYGDLPL
ncbi:DUF1450 domain-containing protein [Brevibacillus invocatus]|uniref:DUF1450 domain-containing protein n=1 Tax=Brevibacillus invocatus TaxID=173959 RepID=A0A3M8CIF8_9BACL|nr:DUF1450 domain-containing protein [Brevibacillus invocatus]MCM3080811.1 DUF1450 domain-containing protein [Brevibacillus invocatus]MCM3430998.1 DUF1450 domain-containing protein [Brevibacillus invocatus]RNB74645.1 DUF1450 domain-containing protein [Brevibacillus invocatus]